MNARPRLRLATFLISLSVILWEILLTRIFSVIVHYHFAFMAVSLAMFGLTIGSVFVFLQREASLNDRLERTLAGMALLFAVLMAIGIIVPLCFVPREHSPLIFYAYLLRTSLLATLVFVPAGSFICLVLTRYQDVSDLYACDLLGAGFGCLTLPVVIKLFGGPGAVLIAASLAGFAALLLIPRRTDRLYAAGLLLAVGLLGGALLNRTAPWLRVRWRHDGLIPAPLHENWNSFSRIMIHATRNRRYPSFWGIDPELLPLTKAVPELFLQIDAGAGTPITSFEGRLEPVQYLRYDLTAFSHYLRSPGETLVIGPGGGRDVLTALVFKDRRVDAVEVNGNILHAVNDVFGDFSGHLDRLPQVHFWVEDGRAFVDRSARKYDIIQASLIDTSAATAAGAYSFTENGLYTIEAWTVFLRHLKPHGVLTFSRWYFGESNWPVEAYRAVGLAAAALRHCGITDPARHLIMVRNRYVRTGREGLATLLMSPDPFSAEDLLKANAACAALRCEVAFDAETSLDPQFNRIVSNEVPSFWKNFPLDISPPDDDRPYFFFHARLADLMHPNQAMVYGRDSYSGAIQTLKVLLALSTVLGIILILLPWVILSRQHLWLTLGSRGAAPQAAYFAAIGLAYIFIEIAFMQRSSLYLGHPTYGFVVTLFALLMSSGGGSWMSRFVPARRRAIAALFVLLVSLLFITEMSSTLLLKYSIGHSVLPRIILTILMIGLPGFVMGYCFPLGMRQVQERADGRVAWYWGINGACSVMASVLAVTTCFVLGIHAAFWVGIVCYALAGFLNTRFLAAGRN